MLHAGPVSTQDELQPGSIFAAPLRATTSGLLILITLIAFEAMAVGAALPTAARELHGLGAYGWAFSGFLIATVVGIVASGQVSDTRGPRPSLVVGLCCFLGGLLLSGTAATMLQLIAGRVVQGLGGGALITAAYVVIGQAYSERLRPSVFAATSSAWVVPSLLGPVVAGLLTQHASWRWVFLGLAPFTVLGGLLLVPVLRTLRRPTGVASFARPIRLLHAVGVAVGVAVIEQAGQHPSVATVAVAVVGLAPLVWGLRELLPAGTFRVRPGVPAPVALRGVLAGSFFGIESTVPLSLTVQHGFSPTAAGLPLAACGVSWAAGSWWQGRADESAGPVVRIRLIRAGFVFVVAAAVLMSVAVLPGAPGWLAYPAWALAGLGAGLAMSSFGVLLLKYTADHRRGADTAALQLADSTASALATGIAGVLIASAVRGAIGFTTAFVTLDLAMGGVALLGVFAAGRARPAGVLSPARPEPAAARP